MTAYNLPTVTVSGTPEEMGLGQGEAFRSLIEAFVAMRFAAAEQYFSEAASGSVDELLNVGKACFEIFRTWDPVGLEEHCAVARGAGVDECELFTAGNMTDFRDVVILGATKADEGCSAILLPGGNTAEGQIIAGQTWDLNPQDIDYVIGVHRKPNNAPETWSVTVSGCPSLVGMNSHGVTVGTTNIKTWGARNGVGYMNILHRALHQSDFEAAANVMLTAPRSGAHTYWFADAHNGCLWESTPDHVEPRNVTDGPVYQTNHCVYGGIAENEWQPPSSSSLARYNRLETLLNRGGHTISTLREVFSDRSDGVDSLNRYAEDDQGTATNSVLLGVPATRELWACRGPADRGVWQQLQFDTI